MSAMDLCTFSLASLFYKLITYNKCYTVFMSLHVSPMFPVRLYCTVFTNRCFEIISRKVCIVFAQMISLVQKSMVSPYTRCLLMERRGSQCSLQVNCNGWTIFQQAFLPFISNYCLTNYSTTVLLLWKWISKRQKTFRILPSDSIPVSWIMAIL